VFQSSGKIQVDSPYGYLFTPLIRNDMTTLEGQNPTQRTIFIESIDATVDIFEPEVFTVAELAQLEVDGLTRFRTPASGSIAPNGGLMTLQAVIVPPELLAAIAPKLTAERDPHHPRRPGPGPRHPCRHLGDVEQLPLPGAGVPRLSGRRGRGL
jgi:hypothetical protein